jgi:integrase
VTCDLAGSSGFARKHAQGGLEIAQRHHSDVDRCDLAVLIDESFARLRSKLQADVLANEHDLPDLVDFLASTGCRIGEAMAVRASRLDLDSDTPVVRADSTAIRVQNRSLIQEYPKSASGIRSIPLSPFMVRALRDRLVSGRAAPLAGDPLIFPSPLGRLRDASNTTSALKVALSRAGDEFARITSRSFRKYVLTELDGKGFSPRQVSDVAGHAQVSMTQDVYLTADERMRG